MQCLHVHRRSKEGLWLLEIAVNYRVVLKKLYENYLYPLCTLHLISNQSEIRVGHILFLKKTCYLHSVRHKTTLGRQTTWSSNFFLHSINRMYNIFITNYFSVFFFVLWSVYLLNWVQGTSNKINRNIHCLEGQHQAAARQKKTLQYEIH